MQQQHRVERYPPFHGSDNRIAICNPKDIIGTKFALRADGEGAPVSCLIRISARPLTDGQRRATLPTIAVVSILVLTHEPLALETSAFPRGERNVAPAAI